MRLKREYLGKYLHDTAILQIADEYKEKGYSISLEKKIGKVQADIVAQKDEEVIVIEVKAGKLSAKRKKEIASLSNYIKKQGNYKFFVVFVNPPQEKRLEIDNFEKLLFDNFQENLPDNLSTLSSNTEFRGFEYIILDEITVQDKQISVKGDGLVNVGLQYGKDSEDGLIIDDGYPFSFYVFLKYTKENKLEISEINYIEVDTSSFYE